MIFQKKISDSIVIVIAFSALLSIAGAQQVGNISISPENPSGSWRAAEPLFPGDTATLNITVEASGTVDGDDYEQEGQPQINILDANSIWTNTEGTNFTAANMGQEQDRYDVEVTVTWKSEPAASGGGGSAPSPQNIDGEATGFAYAEPDPEPTFTWSYDRRIQFAGSSGAGDKIGYTVTGTANGIAIEDMSPYTIEGEQNWTVTPANGAPDELTGDVSSTDAGKGQLSVTENGNEVGESENEIAFAKVDLKVTPQGANAPLTEDRVAGQNGAAPAPHEMDPGAYLIVPVTTDPNVEVKRVKLELTGDSGNPKEGEFTFEIAGSENLKIYTTNQGGAPLAGNQLGPWDASSFSNKTWYVGAEPAEEGAETEEATLTLKYTRELATDNNDHSLEDKVKITFLPVELITDMNNDGEINSADNPLREAALESGASDEDKDKGTEFLFVNDQLSNGIWDGEDSDPDKPAAEKDDDDAQEIRIDPGITEGEVWLEHPAIAGLSFYKTRECSAGDKVNMSPDSKFTVSSSDPFPDQLFVRADGQLTFPADNPQIEGDLVLKIKVGGANGQEIEALKMKFTVVKEFGAKKFFDTVDDYIRENNTKLCVVRKTYGADVFRMVFMLEGYTRMFPIDASRRPGGGQLKGIGAVIAAYPSTVTINGNQCFFIDERNPYLAGLSGDITDRCHGRVVRSGVLDSLVSSDAHLPAHGSPFSPLAGPEPMPDGSRGGNYFTEWAAGNYGIGASVLPSSSTNNAANPASGMGGLSANFNRRQSDGNAVQSIGYYNKTGVETEGIIFTASTEQGSGRAKDLADDAKRSGVKGLSGGRAGELDLLFLDGSTSVALAYAKEGAGIKTVIEGAKHTGRPYYYINTYLIFQSWPTR